MENKPLTKKRRFYLYWRGLADIIFADYKVFDRTMIMVAALGLITQIAIFSSYLYQNSADHAVIASLDNDAGVGIAVAVDTQLYSDNGWRPYGPVYYRIVRLARNLVKDPAIVGSDSVAQAEQVEKAHHFLLMLVSALSIFGVSFLIASAMTESLFYRLLMTIGLGGAFLSDTVWVERVFHAHPDHLFAVTIAFATWRAWRWINKPDDRKEIVLTGASWGLAAAVKLTVTLFAPAIVLLFFPWRRGKTLLNIRDFVGAAFLAYLIVGFPQSLSFAGVIEFLIDQKKNVLPGDFETIGKWAVLFAEQSWRPLLAVLAFSIFVPLRADLAPSRRAYLKLAVLGLVPILTLWSRKIISQYFYYPIPFIAALLVVVAVALVYAWAKIPAMAKFRQSRLTMLAALFVMPFIQPALSSHLQKQLAEDSLCRAEAGKVEAIVDAEAAHGGHVLADPYIPYARQFHDKEIEMAWEWHPDRIKPGVTTMVALKFAYYRIYLPDAEGGNGTKVIHIHDWDQTLAFYRLFNHKTETIDPYGQHWKKTYSDSCTFEIWKRE